MGDGEKYVLSTQKMICYFYLMNSNLIVTIMFYGILHNYSMSQAVK